jgi:hypothetical protein
MNAQCAINPVVAPKPSIHMLQAIRAIQSAIGDGLNDVELTALLQKRELPTEAGFAFLNYCDRVVTLSVPEQNPDEWYPKAGWITPEKESIARSITEKHDLTLYEPPDTLYPWNDSPNFHHHLEMSNGRETIIIVHSQYLKIRLFVAADPLHNTRAAQKPINFGRNLLQDLATLYQA